MQIIINTESNVILLQDKLGNVTINNGTITVVNEVVTEDGLKTMKSDIIDVAAKDMKAFNTVIDTAQKILSPYKKKKSIISLTYTSGVFTISDNLGGLSIYFEKDLPAIVIDKVNEFKAFCETKVTGFSTITFKNPGTLIIDNIRIDVYSLTGADKELYDSITEIVDAALNK